MLYSFFHDLAHGLLSRKLWFLRQVAHGEFGNGLAVAIEIHGADAWLEQPEQDAQEGCFTAAVGAYDAEEVALCNLERDID